MKHTVIVHLTSPFTSLIPLGGVLMTMGFLLFVLALLADMLGRHRRITEELLYLARRRVYSNRRTIRVALPSTPEDLHLEHAENPEGALGPTLHDSWAIPVMKAIKQQATEAAAEVHR